MDCLLISLGVLIVLNVAVSLYLYKREDLDNFQKVSQLILVWLIPFFGAIALWLFNRSQDDDDKPSGGLFGGGSNDRISQLD
mgnify:FL=1